MEHRSLISQRIVFGFAIAFFAALALYSRNPISDEQTIAIEHVIAAATKLFSLVVCAILLRVYWKEIFTGQAHQTDAGSDRTREDTHTATPAA